MQVTKNFDRAVTSEGLVESNCGIDPENMSWVTQILRDQIYADKILAPIRELISNALDEHNKHKIDKDVEVHLNHDTWIVRDYAKGLSEEGMRQIWGMYFKSTKSGDNNAIGGYGVGSKSIFAYADQATIKSYFEGTLYIYQAYLDNGVGKITLMRSMPTDQSGLEIILPIKKTDYNSFRKKTLKLIRHCRRDTRILFKDVNETYVPSAQKEYKLTNDISIFYSNNKYFATNAYVNGDRYLCRMGDITYTFSGLSASCLQNFVLDVPIGAVSLPISREAVEDNEENKKYFEEISDIIRKKYKDYKFEKLEFHALNSFTMNMPDTPFVLSRDNFIKKYGNQNYYYYNKRYRWGILGAKKANKQKIIVELPDSNRHNYWLDRLKMYSEKNPDISILYVREGVFKQSFFDCFIHDEVKKIKEMGTPRREASAAKREYCFHYGHRTLRFSLDEFQTRYPIPKDWNSLSFQELQKYVLLRKTDWGNTELASVCQFAFDKLVKAGYLKVDSPIYIAKKAEDTKEKQEEKKKMARLSLVKRSILYDKPKNEAEAEKFLFSVGYDQNPVIKKLVDLSANSMYNTFTKEELKKLIKLTK